jgi:hypothetical protein
MRLKSGLKSAQILVIAALLPGCVIPHAYLLAPEDAARVSSVEVVPAVREKNGQAVQLRAATVEMKTATPQADGRVRVRSAVKSRFVTAGAVLTLVGSGISIAGGLIFFIGLARNDSTLMNIGYGLAPSAEPMMITGTVMWVVGLRRHPQEIP